MGILLSLFLVQQSVPGLIDRLGSDRIEEREQAEADLHAVGLRAIPELERASGSSDPEVASRARRLTLLIPYRRILTSAIRKVFPRIEEGILRGEKPRWAEVFQALEAIPLEAGELEQVVVPALKDATPREKIWICGAARHHHCRPPLGELLPALAGMDLFQIASLEPWLHLLDVPEATGDLAEALGHPDPGVRAAARFVILARRERDAIPPLARGLASPDAEARREAVVLIRDLELREHASDLLKTLADPDPGVREDVAAALTGFGVREAVPALVRLLQDPASRVRMQALRSLADLGSKDQAGAVAERLRDPQAVVRSEALTTLGRWGALERADEIVPLLADPVYWVRDRAVGLLKALGAREAVPRIRSLLDHPAPWVRANVVGLLSDLAGSDALPWVACLLKDPDRSVRFRAIEVVGRLGAKEFLPDLAFFVNDPDPGVAAESLRAVRSLGLSLDPQDLARFFRTPQSGVRRIAKEALVEADAREVAASLLDLLESGDERVRSDVLALVRDLHLEGARERVILRLDDPCAEVRVLAAQALQHLEGRVAAERPGLLAGLMEAVGADSKRAAVGAIARIFGREASTILRRLLDDEEPGVRLEAAKLLTRWGDRNAASVLAWGADESRVVGLFVLNAVRAPAAWDRLAKGKPPRGQGGTWKQRLESLAKEAGLAVEWDGVDPEDRGLREPSCPRTHARGESVRDAIEEMLEAASFEGVLEEGRIRVLPIEDALLLFRLWDESR